MKLKNPIKLTGNDEIPEKALAALDHLGASRRDFLKTAGVMMVGFSIAGKAAKAQSPLAPTGTVDPTQVDNWLAIGADESITVLTGKAELGQGFRTIQYQLVSEELSVPMSRINLIMCITGVTPVQGTTFGSQSVLTQFGTAGLRTALDTARDALMQLAAEYLDTTLNDLSVTDGVVSRISDPTQSVSYGNLIYGKRFNLTLNANAVPKDPSTWTVLGQSMPRVDIPAKATGSFVYAQKVRVPGMLHGKVVRPSTIGAHLVSLDTSSVAGLPGNVQVVQQHDFVGVVADTEWHAIQAFGSLNVQWSAGDPLPDQTTLYSYIAQLPTSDSYTVNSGDVDQMMAGAAKVMKAQYLHPYQMHGSLGTSCAVADVRGGSGPKASCKVWSPTQGVYTLQGVLSTVLNIPLANVQVIFVDGSGCYGFNGADPVSVDAALLSQAVGQPVRVQYTRRDEMTAGESYGTPLISNLTAGLDAAGNLISWDYVNITATRGGGSSAAAPGNAIPGYLAGFPVTPLVPTAQPTNPTSYSNGNNQVCSYVTGTVNGVSGGTGSVASERVLNRTAYSPLFTSYLRAPNRLQNTWAHECFMDELAAAAKADPVEYRLRFLVDPRLINAVNVAAQNAGWDTRPSPKPGNPRTGVVTGRGFSCVLHTGNNGYCGMVVEVSVDQDIGAIAVTRIVSSLDAGPVCNPDGLRNQMEGGALQGVSRVLHEEVKWNYRAGIVTSSDWVSYPVYQFGDTLPVIETYPINNLNAAPKGAGETTITLLAAAVGNAVFDATGVRMRQIPLTPANFMAAKAAASS
jgi:CO/xanthine dehydrogenase Mo-binding subunit